MTMLLRPLSNLLLPVAAILLALGLVVAPLTAAMTQQKLEEAFRNPAEWGLSTGEFHVLRGGDLVLYVEAVEKDGRTLRHVFIQQRSGESEQVWAAEKGYYWLDLLRTQGSHKVSMKEAAWWSVVWFLAAAAFGAWFWWHLGTRFGADTAAQKTLEYATGYLIEKGLAIENVFVWITIFAYFSIPPEFQKRVLLWGVVGAIVMRAVLIYLGAVLIQQFSWIFYVFGAFLVATGVKMFMFTGKKCDLGSNPLLRSLRNHVPMTTELHGERFAVVQRGKRVFTPLFIVIQIPLKADMLESVIKDDAVRLKPLERDRTRAIPVASDHDRNRSQPLGDQYGLIPA